MTSKPTLSLGYVIAYVSDVPKTLLFWEQAFGLQRRFLHESNQYGELETGSTTLAFASQDLITSQQIPFRPNAQGQPAAGIEIALKTPDIEQAFKQAQQAGATLVKALETKPWGQTTGYLHDINGILVELCTPMDH
jgi:lactoylglutathione lyase